MRSSEQRIEWLFINMRWFLLLAVASVIGMDVSFREATFPRAALLLLVVGGVANLTAMMIALQGNTNRSIRNAMLLYDILLTVGFVASARNLQSQLLFISLVPIMTAALRNSWGSSIVVTMGIVLGYWVIAWVQGGYRHAPSPLDAVAGMSTPIANGAVLAAAGLAVGHIGSRIQLSLLREREEREARSASALRAAHHRASIVFDLAGTLSATLNYQTVLEAALDISRTGLNEFFSDPKELSQVGLILLVGIDQMLYIAKARGISPRDEQLRFPATEGILATAMRGTNPVVSNIPADDPELSRLARIRECQQAIAVPLRAGFECYGLLVLGSSEPDLYTPEFRDLLLAICNQAVLALQNARLYQNLMEEKDRLVTVEEDARKKLARNLHDGPTQTIAAIAMRLNYVRLLIERDPERAVQELQQLEDLARMTTKEIRQMLFTLRPLILESQGLIAALEQLRQKQQETSLLPFHLDAERAVDQLLSKDAKGAIFYIVEEASTNVRRHACAKNLWVRLFQRGMSVVAEVEDDGIGFDVAALEIDYANRGSLGLLNLRERAALVKGKTIVVSSPGKGTKITVTVPVEDAQKDSGVLAEVADWSPS